MCSVQHTRTAPQRKILNYESHLLCLTTQNGCKNSISEKQLYCQPLAVQCCAVGEAKIETLKTQGTSGREVKVNPQHQKWMMQSLFWVDYITQFPSSSSSSTSSSGSSFMSLIFNGFTFGMWIELWGAAWVCVCFCMQVFSHVGNVGDITRTRYRGHNFFYAGWNWVAWQLNSIELIGNKVCWSVINPAVDTWEQKQFRWTLNVLICNDGKLCGVRNFFCTIHIYLNFELYSCEQ